MNVLLFLLGFLIVAGLILDMIGTFTPGFIVYNSQYGPGWIFAYDFLLGYSAWFCVASAGLSIGIIGISVYLARTKI
ncbi:hypothetical protein L5515_009336 [Caenorhabditis briggsae]|uniref:Uncharacterized protein n=1 Tax=Caenorhabditis briggsae TaxID=6238 RepID=A0AAE9FA16_CAEBR|nr:hypothetical protein L5515_009336 [Caenorhabditis briggsae]